MGSAEPTGCSLPEDALVTHLVLGVNHQRPSSPLSHQNAILRGYHVPGQPIRIPLPNFVGVAKDADETEGRIDGDLQRLTVLGPTLYQLQGQESLLVENRDPQ